MFKHGEFFCSDIFSNKAACVIIYQAYDSYRAFLSQLEMVNVRNWPTMTR